MKESIFQRQQKIDKILQDGKTYTCSCFYDDYIICISKIKTLDFDSTSDISYEIKKQYSKRKIWYTHSTYA